MKSFTIFFVLVVVSLAVSVAGKPNGTTDEINLNPTLRTKPFKPVSPTAVFRPDKPDKPDKPEKPDRKKTTTTTTTTTSSSTSSTTPLPNSVSCFVDNPVCGLMCTSVTSKGGVVQSPNYPLDYGDNRNCTVTITVPAKRKIQLKFAAFNLEQEDTTAYDFVYVYDGSMSVFLLNGMSGNKTPPVVTTKTNKMIINFISDDSNTAPSKAPYNWLAAFTSVTGGETTTSLMSTTAQTTTSMPPVTTSPTIPSKDPVTCSTTPECEVMCVNLTLTGGIVQSPNFPLDYGDNRNCIVTITVLPAKKKIQLTFTTFNLETAGGAKGFDYVDVIEGKSFVSLLNGVTGNKIPPVVSTTTNKMVIKFTSDRNNQIPSNATYNWKATFTMI